MTILEAERNLGELVVGAPPKLKRHYQDLAEALEELDVEMLETFLQREEYNKTI
jgi:hypothetical protein